MRIEQIGFVDDQLFATVIDLGHSSISRSCERKKHNWGSVLFSYEKGYPSTYRSNYIFQLKELTSCNSRLHVGNGFGTLFSCTSNVNAPFKTLGKGFLI